MPRFEIEIPEANIPWTYGLLFGGQRIAHSPYVYHVISKILLEHPVHSIVELGTGHGAMAMYLGLWGLRLDVPVHTFDFQGNLSIDVHDTLDKLDVVRYEADIWTQNTLEVVGDIMGGEPAYLFIDGGDKPLEFAMYSAIAQVGSVISVHDWSTEITEFATNETLQLEYVRTHEWMKHDLKLATVQKIGEA